MADGQLAINTNATSAGLFFKDAAGDLVKVGPVHVGTSAPNSSPAGSSGNALGEQWLDTSGGGYVFKVWDGSAWRSEPDQFVDVTGDTMTGNLTVPSLNGGPLAGFRNFIINGLFAVDQRENGGATLANTNIFTRDRWQSITQGSGGLVTVGRSAVNLSSAPNADGAADALIYTTTGALSQGASTNLYLSQKIEGRNFRAMSGWLGNTTDRPVTLSFWVKSSVAGTYSISLLRDPTGIGASNLLTYVASYTIDTADTWEKKTITITAPNDSGASITSYVDLSFHVWGGSSRVAASDGWQDAVSALAVVSPSYNANWGSASGQTFEITAVQLEPGPVATPFEHRPIGTELALCQRYYQTEKVEGRRGGGFFHDESTNSTDQLRGRWHFCQEMRTAPAVALITGTSDGIYAGWTPTVDDAWNATITTKSVPVKAGDFTYTSAAGNGGTFRLTMTADAEL